MISIQITKNRFPTIIMRRSKTFCHSINALCKIYFKKIFLSSSEYDKTYKWHRHLNRCSNVVQTRPPRTNFHSPSALSFRTGQIWSRVPSWSIILSWPSRDSDSGRSRDSWPDLPKSDVGPLDHCGTGPNGARHWSILSLKVFWYSH